MPLVFGHENVVLRVDGDVLEMFIRGAFSKRVPLAWLAVQVQPSIRGHLIVKIASTPGSSWVTRPGQVLRDVGPMNPIGGERL